MNGKLFRILNFSSSKTLTNTLIQYVVPYSIYLPLDIRAYFYDKLKLDTPEKIAQFDKLYDEYERRIYQNFIHEDGFYYTEPLPDGKLNIYALFLPVKLLNEIKETVS